MPAVHDRAYLLSDEKARPRASIDDVRGRFGWSALETYDINAPGQRHGILLGSLGW